MCVCECVCVRARACIYIYAPMFYSTLGYSIVFIFQWDGKNDTINFNNLI